MLQHSLMSPRRQPGRKLALTALTCLVTLPVLAAPVDTSPPRKRPGKYKIGPLYLTPRLELKNAGVDTNVFNSPSGAVPDTSIVLSPSLAGALPIGQRLRFTGKGYLDLNYFRRKGSERSTDFAGEGRGELDFGPFTFFGGGGGGQFKQRFSIDLDERLLRQEKWATTGFDLRLTDTVSATLSGAGHSYAFGPSSSGGSSVQRALDRNQLTGTAQLRYALTSQTTLLASAEAIEDRFSRETVVASRRARSVRYLGGFEFGERAILSGTILAGVRRLPAGQGAPSYRAVALAVSTSVPLWRLGRLAAAAERDVLFSASSSGTGSDLLRNSYLSTVLRAEMVVELPFDLIGRGSVGLQEAKHLLPYQLGDSRYRRVDHLWTGGVSILRAFGDAIRIGAALSWGRRVSNFPGSSYQGFRYGLQAELVP